MKKIFKKLILSVSILSAIFMLSSSGYATISNWTPGVYENVPAEKTTGDVPPSASKVYFQEVNATNIQYVQISKPGGTGLSDRSILATNNNLTSITNGDGTGKLETSMHWENSRIIMTKIYKVDPKKRFTMVVAQNGLPPQDVKVTVGQYNSNLRFLDDGKWQDSSKTTKFLNGDTLTVKTTGQKVYNCTTQWVIPVLRYNNGSDENGTGIEYSAGWGEDYNLNLGENYVYYVFDSFKYTKDLNGGGSTKVVERWGIGNVSSSFAAPTRSGYTFKGWKITDKNGNVIKIVNEYNNVLKTCDCVTVDELNKYNCLDGEKFYTNFFQDLTFTAQWTANTYTNTLNYNANGGSGAPASQSVNRTYPNTAYTHTVSSTVPTRTGYTFAGWYTAASGGTKVGTTYTVGGNNNAGNQSATIYAHWTANTYTNTLSYNANGGTGAPASQSVNRTYPNTAYTHTVSTTVPTRTGYTFAGWYTAASGGTKVGTTYTVGGNNNAGNQSATLYAHWTLNRVNLDYRANGGIINSSSYSLNSSGQIVRNYDNNVYFQSGTYGANITPVTPASVGLSRPGYTFSHWRVHLTNTVMYAGTAYSSTLFNAWNNANANVSNATGFNSVLWAEWTPNSYTVTYNANGGTGSMANSTATYNSAFITRQNTFTKKGYTFAGWNEKADGTGTAWGLTGAGVYESGRTWTWTYTKNITLYAQWVPNTYTVTYNANGGTGSMEASSIVYGKDFITRPNAFTKTGYVFNGWNEKADGTGVAWKLTSPGVYESGKTWPYTYDCNITLYAQWIDTAAPDITHTYKEGNCNTEQSFNITIKDSGSGIKSYTISGAGVTATSGSLTYSNTGEAPLKSITVGVTVKDAGELKITATDFANNTASSSITFIKTFLDNNQSHIAGYNRLATGNEFSSVAGATCHPYTLNTYGETVTPKKPERKGCNNGGWSVNNFAISGSNSITTNGGTYYVVWKDTLAPKVTVKAEEVDNTEWKLTLDIYDATSTGASTYAGSDVVGYYIGGNRDYMKNTYYAVDCNADGSATNIEVNVKPGEMPTIYINVADKAGNVSREGETVLEFKKVTLATRVTDSTSLAEFDYAGKKNLVMYTFYVLNGTRVDFPEARRIGYHGTSDPNKADKSTTWTTGAR